MIRIPFLKAGRWNILKVTIHVTVHFKFENECLGFSI